MLFSFPLSPVSVIYFHCCNTKTVLTLIISELTYIAYLAICINMYPVVR